VLRRRLRAGGRHIVLWQERGGAYGTALYKQVGVWVIIMFVFGFVCPESTTGGMAGMPLALFWDIFWLR